MATVAVYNMEGKEVGSIELSDQVFGVEVNEHLVHLAVVKHLADRRQGTQKAKTRAEVSGGGRKPWRQKGTGHARQGSTRAPQWKGGGVVFAPVPRDYTVKMNRKEKRAALKSVLTDKVKNGNLIVLEDLTLDEIKTTRFVEIMKNLQVETKALVITGEKNTNAYLSSRNLPTVQTTHTGEMNVYDVINAGKLILTKEAVQKIEEVFA